VDNHVNASLTIDAQDSLSGRSRALAMKLERLVDMTRCLLIDEDGKGRRYLQQMLSGLGLETSLTANGDEALQYCNDNAPELVMLSADSRGLAPRELVKRLQFNARGKPPVVILYAERADTEMFGQSILEGAADVLMMPLDRDLLQFKLQQAGVIA
jgi:two-component system chemotaxis response regulator CheY